MSFCGLKQQAQNFLLSCGGKKNKINSIDNYQSLIDFDLAEKLNTKKQDFNFDNIQKIDENFDDIDDLSLSSFNTNIDKDSRELSFNMSKNATLLDIITKEHQELYKLLNQSSLSKSANIPMIVIKSFKPSNKAVDTLPKVSNGIKIFTHSGVNTKQIEVHRGMTVNAIFCREKWLYIKTAQNEHGYVPIDCCKPVVRRDISDSECCEPLPLTAELLNSNRVCDSTNVSLFDISKQNVQDQYGCIDENISEFEFSMCCEAANAENNNKMNNIDDNSNLDYIRLFKIKHYLKSLASEQNEQQTPTLHDAAFVCSGTLYSSSSSINNCLAVDSGISDNESNSNSLRLSSRQSYEYLANCTKRRGIKTNGSICSISPNPTVNSRPVSLSSSSTSSLNEITEPIQVNNATKQPQRSEIEVANYKLRTNLSTIIEQSYNTTLSMTKINNESGCEIGRVNQSKSSFISIGSKVDQDVSRLKSINDNDELAQNMVVITESYDAMFVEDLSVEKGEIVTILESKNNDWCYVIGKNGKGYIPKTSFQ